MRLRNISILGCLGAVLLVTPLAAASELEPLSVAAKFGKVYEFQHSADGKTLLLRAMQGRQGSAWWTMKSDGTGLRQLSRPAPSWPNAGLTESGNFAFISTRDGWRIVPLRGGKDRVMPRGDIVLGHGDDLFLTGSGRVRWYLAGGARTRPIRVLPATRLPASGWTKSGTIHQPVSSQLGWCGARSPDGPIEFGWVDKRSGVLRLRSTGVVPTNGWGGCNFSDDGLSVSVSMSLDTATSGVYANRTFVFTRGRGLQRFSLPSKGYVVVDSFSPGGRFGVALASNAGAAECGGRGPQPAILRRLYLLDAHNGRMRVLPLSARPSLQICSFPTWASDGRTVAFATRANGRLDSVRLLDPLLGRLRRITPPRGAEDMDPIRFTPDGSRLILDVRFNGKTEWYSVRRDGSGLMRISSDSFRPAPSGGSNISYARSLWFGSGLAWVGDENGVLFTTDLAGFGGSSLTVPASP